MAKLNQKKFIFNGIEWDILSKESGELPIQTDENGELLERVIHVTDYYKDDNEEAKDSYFNNDNTFIRDFRGNGKLFRLLLKPQEIALLTFLSDYISYNDCILRVNGNRKAHILSVEELADEYGMNYDAFRKIMTALRKKQVIDFHDKNTVETTKGIIDQRCITFNPYIKCRGKKVDEYIIEHYSSTLWAEVERQKTKSFRNKTENI